MRLISTRLLLILLVTLLIGGGIFFGIQTAPLLRGYQVHSVPFFGNTTTAHTENLYAAQEQYLYARGSAAASLLMVGGFWRLSNSSQPLLTIDEVGKALPFNRHHSLTDVAVAARELGFKATIKPAYLGIWSIGGYARRNIPVIVEQTLSSAHPQDGINFRVVLGTSSFAREVFVHDYVFGEFQSMPKDEFYQVWQNRNFLVIEPANDIRSPAVAQFTYTTNPFPEEQKEMYSNRYIGIERRFQGRIDEAIVFYEKTMQDPQFGALPFEQQHAHLSVLLDMYVEQNRYSDGVKLEDEINEITPNVSKTFFGNVPSNRKAIVFTRLGESFMGVGDTAKARKYALLALQHQPGLASASYLLEQTR